MKAGSTRCTARYRGSAAADRPVPSWARASQYRSSLRWGCSLRAAHQRGGQERLRLAEHLQADPGHAAEEAGLYAQHGVVDQRIRVPGPAAPSP